MAWLSLTLPASREDADELSDALMALGALSVSIEDAQADSVNERPVFGEPGSPEFALWQDNRLVALLPESVEINPFLALLAESTGRTFPVHVTTTVDDQDWVRATQSEFDPIPVGDCLWIVPSWHALPADALQVIRLDPGLAFGTGSHPTTRLCLEWLCQHRPAGLTVLDYGCGSGILAIAAAKLGAQAIVGVDLDPQAIQTARENSLNNQVEVDCFLPGQETSAGFDLVIANILTNPLLSLAPLLAARCRAGGQLVLSGILHSQVDLVMDGYQDWFSFDAPRLLDDWACLSGRRKS